MAEERQVAPVTPVVDAHVAVGSDAYFDFTRPESILAGMDAAGVERAVLGPFGAWLAVDNREGNETLAGWLRRWPDRFSAYAGVNPWYGARAVDELRRALDDGLGGLKLHPAQQGLTLLNPLLEPLCECAADAGIPVYAVTGVPVAAMPFQLAELARRHPGGSFVMGRSGRTDFKPDFLSALELAGNLLAETAHNEPSQLHDVLERYGPSRLLFSSDAPFTDHAQERRKLDDLHLAPDVAAQVGSGNAARLFGSAVAA